MLFSDHPRTHYRNAPAHEVICQLRFPAILTINNVEPADFQEAIRAEFPQYARRQDAAPPRITGLGGPSPKVEQQPPVTNHNFISEDNQWKLNLTKDFIALSTLRYPGWEAFARQLSGTVIWATSEQRARVHLAAVFACNFANHMYAVGERIVRDAGIDFDVLKPLIAETAAKACDARSPLDVQTGPAVRNDFATKARHGDLLSFDLRLKNIYSTISQSIWETSKKI